MIQAVYARLAERVQAARQAVGRPLTLAEKILYAHLFHGNATEAYGRGKSYVDFAPDRVAMQDATAQMALLQFMQAGRARTAVPSTVHCDHLIQAKTGALADLQTALTTNQEVYDFLASVSNKYGIGFWKPGAGIIHQVVLENYAFPGGMMIGTDSHTPNAGGLGMIAVGVGGADAVDVMVGMPWNVRLPKLVGVRLTGELSGWTAPKDVILKLASILTVKGGTGKIVEYFGPGTASISCTGKATITNMGAELGATTSIFPYDDRMGAYLRATGRDEVARLAAKHAAALVADPEVAADPARFYDEIVEIDLSTLEPHIVGPHTPDLARPVSQLGADARKHGYPIELKAALIGSCTNSSYEDLDRAAHVARQAATAGLTARSGFLVTPGSVMIHETIARDGQLGAFEQIGGTVLANACGPCIGQWKRDDIQKGQKNSILTSFNRNFSARNDSNPETNAFIGSPEIVTAYALAGTLDWNPLTDPLEGPDGVRVMLEPPVGDELPRGGFATDIDAGYLAPPDDGSAVEVHIDPKSDRLEQLEPFKKWSISEDFRELVILVKAKGKCTTDHISPAGPWLRYRGHLSNISDNMYSGAVNAFTGEAGRGTNVLTGGTGTLPAIAKEYKQAGQGWVVVADENYGEGSSREHAAMEPRFMGSRAVIAKSFARIAETNLKKQGLLPLWLKTASDYGKFQANDRVELRGLGSLAPDSVVTVVLRHEDGSTSEILAGHTLSPEQIEWFEAGSALNRIAELGAG
jgi:aconitate hydratase